MVTTLGIPEEFQLAPSVCDRCPASGPLRVFTTSGELAFCRHHGKMYAAWLRRYPAVIVNRDRRLIFPDEDWWNRFGWQRCACSPGCRVGGSGRTSASSP